MTLRFQQRITHVLREPTTKDLSLLIFIVLITTSAGSIVIPLFVGLRRHYQQNAIGFIEAAFMFLSTLSMIAWGIVTDRVKNRKPLFLLFFSVWTIPSWMLGLMQPSTLVGYATLRLIMALGVGGMYPLVISYLGDLIPPSHRSTLSSLNAIAILIGTGLGILIGGITGEEQVFRPFIVLAMLGTLGLLLTITSFVDLPRGFVEKEVRSALQQGMIYQFVLNMDNIRLIFRQKSNYFLLFQGWLALIPSGMLTYYLVAFFSDTNNGGLGYPLVVATFLGLGFASGRFFGYLFFGYLGDKAKHVHESGPVIVATVSTFIQAPLLIFSFFFFTPHPFHQVKNLDFSDLLNLMASIFTPNLLTFGALLFLTTFCGAGSAPNRQAIMYDVNVPETRAVMSGLYSLMDQVGLSLGIMLGSILIGQWGYGMAFSVATMGWILSAFTWALATFTYPRDQHAMHEILSRRLKPSK